MTDSTSNDIQTTSDIKVGDFVRFSSKDNSGHFSHVGEVIKIQKETKKHPGFFEMLTFDGTMGFVLSEAQNDVYNLKICNTKPTGWAKFKKNPKAFNAKVEEKPIEPVKSIRQQVYDIVVNNKRKSKKVLLKLVSKEIQADSGQLESYIDLALSKIKLSV